MRILIVARAYLDTDGLLGNFELDQARALKNAGNDVRMIGYDHRSIKHKRRYGLICDNADEIKKCIYSFPLQMTSKISRGKINQVIMYKAYERITKDNWTPDIIHAHFGYIAFDSIKIFKSANNSKIVITEHDSKMNTRIPEKRLLSRCMKAYNLADGLISVGSKLAENLYYTTDKRFYIIPNMLDPLLNNVSFSDRNLLNQEIRIISAGNFFEIKQFPLLISALAKVDYPFHLDIYGDGIDRKRIEERIKIEKLTDKVTLHGKVPRYELIEAYRNSNLFILLSKSETFGLVFAEAMACGLPVVSLRCGGTDDIITDLNGMIIDSMDRDIIAEKIELLMNNIENFDAKTISNYSINRFGNVSVANQLIEFYKQL